MGTHNNVHIPKESWPHWTWFAIEFFIVMAVGALVSNEIVKSAGQAFVPAMQNWLFFGIIGVIHLAWYLGIRRLVFKKRILETKY